MSDSGSKNQENTSTEEFTEHDHKETQLGYGDGRVPFYVAALWVLFIGSYLTIMVVLALPDFQLWSSR